MEDMLFLLFTKTWPILRLHRVHLALLLAVVAASSEKAIKDIY